MILESIPNRNSNAVFKVEHCNYCVTVHCPLKSHIMDFRKVTIIYEPHEILIETGSLIPYFKDFSVSRLFSEDLLNVIFDDIYKLVTPRYLKVILVGENLFGYAQSSPASLIVSRETGR